MIHPHVDGIHVTLTTMHTLDDGPLFQLRLGYPTDTGRPLVVHILGLDTSDATELFVTIPDRSKRFRSRVSTESGNVRSNLSASGC